MKCFVSLIMFMTGLAAYAAMPVDSLSYMMEGQAGFSSGEHTPFWLVNNKQGLSSIEKDNGYLRAGIFRSMNRSGNWGWGAGVDLVLPYNYTSSFVVQQLYGEIRYRKGELTLGSKEWQGEFNNPRLSSGNMFYSGNSRPVPQARLSFPDYIRIPGTHGWLAVKGYIAFGAFTDDAWQRSFVAEGRKRTEHVLYHAKGGYLRIGDPEKHPLIFEGGMEMGAQFGGDLVQGGHVTHMPAKLKDFIKVLIPSGGGSDTPLGEQTNVYGNHLGAWNACLTWMPEETDWSFKAYYEHYFEDHSMMFFEYLWKDMLLGAEVTFPKNPVITGFVYEYLYSKDQAGAVYWDHTPLIPEQVSGRDDYYNHGLYTGWQHWGMGIGNPLFISPIYNTDGQIAFKHNRLKGHHFGIEGSPLPSLGYRALFSYTRSWGTYGLPTSEIEKNYNLLLELTYRPQRLKGWSGTVSFGIDRGAMLGKSAGAMVTIRKTGWL